MPDNQAPRLLLISARSDIGGGPAHMFTLAQGLNPDTVLFAALPDDGVFFSKFASLIGSENVTTIPRQKFSLGTLLELRPWCRKNKIDLIHSHGKGAGVYSRLLGLLLGVPVLHTLHGYHDGQYSALLKWVYALWETLASCLTKRIICVSNSEAKLFQSKVMVSVEKLRVIPNGTAVQAESVVTPTRNKIVTVARFDYQKNLPELLEIALEMPDYHFFIIGDGAGREEIEALMVHKSIGNVTLCGESRRVLEDISDAQLYLSTARWEGLPLAILEAMSLGVPVVASDVVGNQDAVFEGVTGYLYPLGNASQAKLQITEALKLDRREIQAYHRRFFSSERMVEQTSQQYKRLIG